MRGRRAGQRHDHRTPLKHHRPVEVAAAVLAVTTTLATFLPWGTSGERSRSSHALVDVVDQAGILSSSASDAARLWYLVPLLCGTTLVAFALRSALLVAAASGTLGAVVVVGGALVIRSPLVTEPGAVIAVISGAATVGAGIGTGISTKRRRR